MGAVLTKAGAKPGDQLFITKPLGFGVTTTALKREKAEEKDVEQAVSWMKRLNRDASRLARDIGLDRCNGYHRVQSAGTRDRNGKASQVHIHFNMEKIPLLDGALKYANMGTFPGGASDNRMYFGENVTICTFN